MVRKLRHLMEQMRSRDFMELAADDALASLRGRRNVWYAAKFKKNREKSIDTILTMTRSGVCPKKTYKPVELRGKQKTRTIYPLPFDPWSIIFHAMKRLLDPIVERSSIHDTSAGIRGRGQHYGARRMASLIRRHKDCAYFSQSDLKKFYYSMPHGVLMDAVRRRVDDEEFMRFFESVFLDFVWEDADMVLRAEHERKLLHCTWAEHTPYRDMDARGVIIGGPLCQWAGNVMLLDLDHRMKEVHHVRAYHRHCDDIVMLARDKEEATRQLHVLDMEMNRLGLVVKADSCVAPIKDEEHGGLGRGIDFMGYVFSRRNIRMRKRTKQNFARKMHKVRSRRRRREVAASYYGIAKWGRCRHMWQSITHGQKMAFADFGIKTEQIVTGKDGKRMFDVPTVTVQSLAQNGGGIIIHDFEAGLTIKDKPGKCSVLFSYPGNDGDRRKFITSSAKIIEKLSRARDMETAQGVKIFPQETRVREVRLNGGRYTYDID